MIRAPIREKRGACVLLLLILMGMLLLEVRMGGRGGRGRRGEELEGSADLNLAICSLLCFESKEEDSLRGRVVDDDSRGTEEILGRARGG